jgi:hypothetical protein
MLKYVAIGMLLIGCGRSPAEGEQCSVEEQSMQPLEHPEHPGNPAARLACLCARNEVCTWECVGPACANGR